MNYSSFNSTENYGRRSDGIVKRLMLYTQTNAKSNGEIWMKSLQPFLKFSGVFFSRQLHSTDAAYVISSLL